MEDEQLISELKQLANQNDKAAQAKRTDLIQQIKRCAGEYQQTKQHWLGISLLARAREVIAPMADLDRMSALLLGGKAELVMGWADGLRTTPPADLLSMVEDDLLQAIKIDPSLADPYWDFAVINARYCADYTTASKYLSAAMELGYFHPMMANLKAMIQAQPSLEPAPDTDETKLRQLLLRLAVQATGPMNSWLLSEEESKDLTGPIAVDEKNSPKMPLTFGDYVREAKTIASNRNISEDQYLKILDDSRAITSDSAEYIADLLRRLAEFIDEPVFLNQATYRHLQLIRVIAFQFFEHRDEDPVWLRRSLRAAERGLNIINVSHAAIDLDLHADLLIAKGQAFYYKTQPQIIEAIRCYHEALGLKRQAKNTTDVEKMKDILWRQIDDRRIRTLFSLHIGGVGEALEILKICAEVADDLENPPHSMDIRASLASVMREVGQYKDAEEILHEIIASSPPENILRNAKFELASIFSETGRPKEAAEIQRQLLDDGGMDENQTTAVLWSNYANSLSLLNDFEGARAALEKAWELLPPNQQQKIGDAVPDQGARIKMLFAQIDFKTGHYAEALKLIASAEALNPTPLGLDGLHFYEIKARCMIAVGRSEDALKALDTAIYNFRYLLSNGPSLPSWESLLHQWSHLDVMAVQTHIGSGKDNPFENALLRAESAKGRVSAWLEHWAESKSAEQALAINRQVEALEIVRQWLGGQPGRRVISLFGSDTGLGVFDIDGSGKVQGVWLDDFNYDLVRQDVFDPWERLVDQALSTGDPESLVLAGTLTDYLLDSVGTWLCRAHPCLAAGGSDLVIIPHRLFRSLPLAHARLPNGKRLSDLFDTVVINPSLGDLGQGMKASKNNDLPTEVIALADAEDKKPLLFARCEGILSGANENLMLGSAVTADTVASAFGRQGILLLSLHGDFDEKDPFHSRIFTADGHLSLHQLILGQTSIKSQIVVLGVCEAGRFRRSLSDEPIGFPAIILQSGVAAVVAPVWQVEDFASFLFITKLFDTVKQGMTVFHAMRDTACWLRALTAQNVLKQTDYLMGEVVKHGEQGKLVAEALKSRLEAQKAWIETLKPSERPFRSPLDWAAFQIIGVPPIDSLTLHTQ